MMQRSLFALAQSAIVLGPEHGRNMDANRLARHRQVFQSFYSIVFLFFLLCSSASAVVGLVAHVQWASIILLVASGGAVMTPSQIGDRKPDPYAVIVLLFHAHRFLCVSSVCASHPSGLSSFGPVRGCPCHDS